MFTSIVRFLEKQFHHSQVNNSFTSGTIKLKKGERITIVAVQHPLVLIKTSGDNYGYIPLNILKPLKSSQATPPPVSLPSILPEVIIRKRVSLTQLNPSSLSPAPPSEEETFRPDTPPIDAFREADLIVLSDVYNSHPSYSTLSVHEYYDQEVPHKDWKDTALRFLKSLRPKRQETASETISQTSSIHTTKTIKTETGSLGKKSVISFRSLQTSHKTKVGLYEESIHLSSAQNSKTCYI